MGFLNFCSEKFQKFYKNSRRTYRRLVSKFSVSITELYSVQLPMQLPESKDVVNALSSPYLVWYTAICAAITYIAFISGATNAHFGLVMGGMLGALSGIRRIHLQNGMYSISVQFLL